MAPLYYSRQLLCFILLLVPFALWAAQKDLARVAILTYDDETGTKNFAYMPGSLTEAIDKSLQKRFEYVREEPKKSEAQRRKIKAAGVFNAREAAQYCQKYDVQILVFGRFTYDAVQKQIVVNTWISLGSEANFRQLAERRNPTDATIFNLADKVAEDIVNEMTLIAKEQQSKKQEKPATEKIELEKVVTPTWAFKNYSLSLLMGSIIPAAELADAYRVAFGFGLAANRMLWRSAYAGLRLHYMNFKIRSTETWGGAMSALPITVDAGYAFLLLRERLRLNTEAGLGYYAAQLTASVQDPSASYSRKQNFGNPAARLGVSAHYLLSASIALGGDFSYLILFDKSATSGKVWISHLGVSYVF